MEPSEETAGGKKNPVLLALDPTMRWFGNLLAPLVIITYAKEAEAAFHYLVERPVLTSVFFVLFAAVLAYNVLRTVNIQVHSLFRGRRVPPAKPVAPPAEQIEETPRTEPARPAAAPHSLTVSAMRCALVGLSVVALAVLVYAYVALFVTGLHYVVVASAPDEASAIEEIQSLNQFFERKGRGDLEARAHASSGSAWYMISIGGLHTSRAAAERTLQETRAVMGPAMRADAYIYSRDNTSPVRVILNWLRAVRRSLFGG